MTIRQQLLTAAAATALFSIGGPALASDNGNLTFEREVNSCIAEISDHANYNDATRVRHIVVTTKQTRFGFVFTIDTSVYTKSDGTAVREYASYCDAIDDDKPVKFRIREISA